MSFWSRKKADVPISPAPTHASPGIAPFHTFSDEQLRELLEYTYVSGFNYAFTLAKTREYRKRPSARQQFSRWCKKMSKDVSYEDFRVLFEEKE